MYVTYNPFAHNIPKGGTVQWDSVSAVPKVLYFINGVELVVSVVDTPATNVSGYLSPVTGHIKLPETGISAGTSLKVTNVAVTHVTVYYG